MKERYYGWLGIRGYDGVVKVINNCEAYVYNKRKKFFERDDDYLKAAFIPEVTLTKSPKMKLWKS